jgi:hypothetical protein
VEGKTEERVLRIMKCPEAIIQNCKGKSNIVPKINEILGVGLRGEHTSVLILRDRDVDETIDSIKMSFESCINNLLNKNEASSQFFQMHSEFGNIFTINAQDVDFQVVLHIASPPSIVGVKFDSDTIDGYIFALAYQSVLRSLLTALRILGISS